MSPQVVSAAIKRIRDHSIEHGLRKIDFVFHGGEPLLAGKIFSKTL